METQQGFIPMNKVEKDESNLILKIKSVLLKLTSPEFNISDDTILQKLYDCISQIFSVEDCHSPLLEIFMPWIENVIKGWGNINTKSCIFALRILSLISSNESDFCSSLNLPIFSDTLNNINNCDENNFSLVLAYLELINSVISHNSGCIWVFENGIWKEILNISRKKPSLYILRQSHNIIADMVVYFATKNVTVCQNIIDEVFFPCYNTINFKKDKLSTLLIMKSIPYQKECFNGTLTYLNSAVLLREIIMKMMLKKIVHNKIESILAKYNLTEWIYETVNNTENVRVIAELSRLLSILNICSLPHCKNGSVNYSDMRTLCQHFLDHCNLLISKSQFILLNDACIEYFKLWNKFGGEIVNVVKEVSTDSTYGIENTIFIILTEPLFIVIRICRIPTSELMEAYAERIFGVACFQTKRTCYLYKKELKVRPDISLETIAASTVQSFVRIAKICKKEQGVMIFQTLVHIMRRMLPSKDVIGFPDMNTTFSMKEVESHSATSMKLLSATLEALNSYISNFDLSWSDSLETLCVLPLLQKLLGFSNLSPRIVVDALQLKKVVLLGYLPTNLALLMDTLQGSSIRFLGKEIFRHLHSMQWEVRDTALELLQVVCALAEHKLPVFQKMLLEDDLPNLVVSILECDSETYVRVSALNCLSYMVRIQSIWDACLADKSLIEKSLHLLLHDSEGIVRYKAVLLVKEIYNCKKLNEGEMATVLDSLYHATLTDLHWEVKTGAILFWDCILDKELASFGMVDGSFPDHLFSGEKKKIIKLTPTETSIRIQRVFKKLSTYGCLHALWNVIRDDCDLEVTREAGKLITKMIDLINKFQVPINRNGSAKTSEEMAVDRDKFTSKRKFSLEEVIECPITKESGVTNGWVTSTDKVIESIVSESDSNLVCGLIKNADSKDVSLKLLERVNLPLSQFYTNVIEYDVIGKQLEKARWLYKTSDGIASLLDDILVVNQFDVKCNAIDCY